MAAEPETPPNLEVALARGVAWTGAVKVVAQTVSWLSTLVVAHLLTPADYGLMGMATLYLGLLQLLSEFGIGTALVSRPQMPRRTAAQLNTVAVLVGAAGSVVVAVTAPLVAAFFRTPRLAPVLAVLGLTFLVSAFRTVPWALLQRDLAFKRLAAYDGVQSVLLAAGSVAMAAAGFRHWTLVLAALASALVSTAIAVLKHPIGFARPEMGQVRETLVVSADLLLQRLSWYGYSNADFLVAGRVLGTVALGQYTLAWTLACLAVDKLGATLLQVTPGVLSRARGDLPTLRRFVVRITELVALVVCPISAGISVVAPPFVKEVLGERWTDVIRPLRFLAAYATVRALLPLFSQVLLVFDDQRYGTRVNLTLLLLLPPTFFVGSQLGGITGIAAGWTVVYPVVAFALARRAIRHLDVSAAVFVRETLGVALPSVAVMALATFTVQRVLPPEWPQAVQLAIQVVTGALVYPAMLFTVFRTRMRELIDGLRALRAAAAAAG